jgi:hypothetical protein
MFLLRFTSYANPRLHAVLRYTNALLILAKGPPEPN